MTTSPTTIADGARQVLAAVDDISDARALADELGLDILPHRPNWRSALSMAPSPGDVLGFRVLADGAIRPVTLADGFGAGGPLALVPALTDVYFVASYGIQGTWEELYAFWRDQPMEPRRRSRRGRR
jgi:hypothetical protein